VSEVLSEEVVQQFPLPTSGLPDGWQCVWLSNIASDIGPGFACGKHNSTGAGVPHLRPMNIDRDGSIALGVIKSVISSEGTELVAGDVLFNNTNSAELVGKTAVVSIREHGFAFSNHMTRIRLELGVEKPFVARYLHFLWMSGYMKHRCTNHVNQASISSKTLSSTIPILLPPATEQTRIVEKLEEILSDLDSGVVELKAAQKKVVQYRQSLLKAAVEGALTTSWRAQQAAQTRQGHTQETGAQLLQRILRERRTQWETKQTLKFQQLGKTQAKEWQTKYPESVAPDTRNLPYLPAGWVWASVDQLSPDDLANGRSVPTAVIGAKVLRLTAVKDGEIDLAESKVGDWSVPDAKPFAVADGDLLIVRGNGSLSLVGRAGIVSDVSEQIAYPDTMIRLRTLNSIVRSQWIGLMWNASSTRTHLERRARTSAGIYKISQPDIVSVMIPVPPLDEQDEILAVHDQNRENLRLIQAMLEKGLNESAAQRKNILKSAFSGQLVPQDSSDEPASVLLERIRKERVERESRPRDRRARIRKIAA
jgi:type I restriction enzyme, S subunit